MDDLVLKALKEAIERYPEIVPYLKGKAAKIAADGVEWHQKFKPYDKPYQNSEEDWDDWEVTEEDIERAVKRWNEAMPDYAGMLDAQVEIDENAE